MLVAMFGPFGHPVARTVVTLAGCLATLVGGSRYGARLAMLLAGVSMLVTAIAGVDRATALHLALLFTAIAVIGTTMHALRGRDPVAHPRGAAHRLR